MTLSPIQANYGFVRFQVSSAFFTPVANSFVRGAEPNYSLVKLYRLETLTSLLLLTRTTRGSVWYSQCHEAQPVLNPTPEKNVNTT